MAQSQRLLQDESLWRKMLRGAQIGYPSGPTGTNTPSYPPEITPVAGSGIPSGGEVSSGSEVPLVPSGSKVPLGNKAPSGSGVALGSGVASGSGEVEARTEVQLGTEMPLAGGSDTFQLPGAGHMPRIKVSCPQDARYPTHPGRPRLSLPRFAPGHLPSSSIASGGQTDAMEVDIVDDRSNPELTWEQKHGDWNGMPLDEKLLSMGTKVLKADSRRIAFARQSSQVMENIIGLATRLHLRLNVTSCIKWVDYNSMLVKLGDEWSDNMVDLFTK
ncbi:hypothetical protein LXA43DRAFT_1062870 [Ganoderma leucocontextum]|nr:hypothetical protein LXA43DRAFT_1062870 [Ganoderma leucocontextum]